MASFSFLVLLIRMLSLCPLVSLAKGLCILLIFSKNQLLVLVDSLNSSFCFHLVDFSPEFDDFFAVYSSWMNLLPFVLELLGVLSSC